MSAARPLITVLVVDDDAPVRTLAAQALQGRGYHVLVAGDLPEALRTADAHPSTIHVLLTDIMLPSGNGMELARAVLVKRPETAVLYMSGFKTEMIHRLQDGEAPDGGFLDKPFTPRLLIERIQMILPMLQEETDLPPPRDLPPSSASADQGVGPLQNSEAVYRLESPVKCPQCGDIVSMLKVVRLLRMQVNFTSTLPRRGRVAVCPNCLSVVPAELSNF
jgi:DNA-binding response OmpR family regulator